MSSIAIAATVTWTTTSCGGYTKTTLPATAAGGAARTLDFPDPALQAIINDFRAKIVQLVMADDPNANVDCVVTGTVT